MANISLNIGTVREIENTFSENSYDGLRIRAELLQDKPHKISDIPWAFPLLPKVFQSIPKIGEAVFILVNDDGNDKNIGQRYYIGPIVSQPQYNTYCKKENATTLLDSHDRKPLAKISNVDYTRGAFPKSSDVAVVGRGKEDIILKYNDSSKASEIDLRAGIRGEPTNSSNKNIIGNIIFNDVDPAYIQLKYKGGIAKGGNSVINMVADKINIMSNKDENVSHNLHDKETLIADSNMKEVMSKLHQVPMGDKLVELLTIMKGCIMHHVHPWAGMEQCGDWSGFMSMLDGYDINSILSQHVRIS